MGILQDSLEVVKFAAKLANPELIQRVTALNEQVLELSSKNVEFQQRVFELERQLQQSNDKLVLVGEVERKDGFVYVKNDPEPCCPRCFDVDKRLVRIAEMRDKSIVGIQPTCPQCKSAFVRYPQGLSRRNKA